MLIRYRVEKVHGDELSFPVTKADALKQITDRMGREPVGDPLKVVRVEYQLNPEQPPTIHTRAMEKLWRGIVVRFPEVGTLGVYVCKDDSQHRFGNAGDWAAPPSARTEQEILDYLWPVARFARAEGMRFERGGLPCSEVIFRDQIATRVHDWTWRPYTGTFHAAHVHTSAYPLYDTDLPCGVP